MLQGVQARAPAAAEKVLAGHWEHALFVVPPVVVEHEVAWKLPARQLTAVHGVHVLAVAPDVDQ